MTFKIASDFLHLGPLQVLSGKLRVTVHIGIQSLPGLARLPFGRLLKS